MLHVLAGRSQPIRSILTGVLIVAVLSGWAIAASPARAAAQSKPTVVLVHGAFADASGWSKVIGRLQRRGYPVIAPANPLRSVSGDATYLKNLLSSIEGPIILVGHSYAGFVMTNAATGNPNVKALVYIAAFAPAEGDTVGGLTAQRAWQPARPGDADHPDVPGAGRPARAGGPTSRRARSAPCSPATCRRCRPTSWPRRSDRPPWAP